MKAIRLATLLAGAALMAACAPTTTSGLEAPRGQLPTLGQLAEEFVRPFREMDFAALFAEGKRQCYVPERLLGTLNPLAGEAERIKLEKVLADPAKRDTFIQKVKEIMTREYVALDKLEVRLNNPRLLPEPGQTYFITVYLEIRGAPRLYSAPVTFDPYGNRLCHSRNSLDTSTFYLGIGEYFSRALQGL